MYLAEAIHNRCSYLGKDDGYKEYFESARNGIIYLDYQMKIKILNKEAERICGIERARVLDKKATLVFENFGEKFLKMLELSDYEDLRTANLKLKVQDQYVYVHVDSLRLLDKKGDLSGILVILQDVSTARAAIKQIQTTQMLMSLGELAAGVAHHVRTPLTTISGYLQVMVGRLEDDKYTVRKDVLENLLDEVSYINNVVKELILFAKPPIQKSSDVSVNTLTEDALRLTFKEMGGENIHIDKQLASNLPSIYADYNLIKQAVVNIMQNAMEAMPEEGVLTLRSWLNADLNMLVISIADSGMGINPEILPRVFEPFYTNKLDRMGLGLPIAHRIVAEHGGFINISANDKKGTKVHLYLPIFNDSIRQIKAMHQQILNLQ